MARVAFIGLGNMGGGMAANLAKAGHDVRRLRPQPPTRSPAPRPMAARSPTAPRHAVANAEAVVTMLPAGKHVAEVYRTNVLLNAPKTAILMDCSTIDVATAKAVAGEARVRRVRNGRRAGVGRDCRGRGRDADLHGRRHDDAFAKAQPLLEKMGKAVIHAGDAGAGQAAKIVNNMLLGVTMAGTCEAFVLAQKLGLDPQKFFDISSKASGQSWSMTSYCPVPGVGPETPADRNYEGGFAAALMLKDLKLAAEAAAEAGAYTPMGGEAEELYQRFVDRGGAAKDFSALIKMIDDSWEVPVEGNIKA